MNKLGPFELGKVHCVDSLDAMKLLPDKCVYSVVTDPPYGIDGGKGLNATRGKADYNCEEWSDTEEYVASVVVSIIKECRRISTTMAVTCGCRCLHLYPRSDDIGCFWIPAARGIGRWGFCTYIPILYYGKDPRAGKGPLPNGIKVVEPPEKNGHPCPKPIKMWMWLVDKVCAPGGLVVDPFMGSGTTGVACVQTGRQFLGFEIDPEYCRIANERIAAAHKGVTLKEHRTGQESLFDCSK